MINNEKIDNWIKVYKKEFDRFNDDYSALCLGNCLLHLGEFEIANEWYKKSFERMFRERPSWKGASSPNHFVDIWLLSNKKGHANQVHAELVEFRKIRYVGDSPLADYAFSLWKLSTTNDQIDIQDYNSLLKLENRHKYGYYLGRTLQSISNIDNKQFTESIRGLLKAHEGSAKYGSLRETAEGLICLSAMSLALQAIKRGLEVNIINDYFSMGYLEYLL
jgi:hypothetical protein